MNKKTNYNLVLGIIFLFLIISIGVIIIKPFTEPGIAKPNYLGLAKLGLIPNSECTHSQDAYTSTGVVARTSNGDYAILESKFGDEYCPVRIK